MANASDTQAVLHTINEEVHEGERDTWRTTEDPVVIANFRAAAKSNHTKQLRKIEAALVDPLVSSERLSDMRKKLVRCYEDVDLRQQRLLSFLNDDGVLKAEKWMEEVTAGHRNILARVNVFCVDNGGSQSVKGSHRSKFSNNSVHSAMSKLLDAELEVKAKELALNQLEREEERRRQDEESIRIIKASQARRQLEYEVEQSKLRASTIQSQLGEMVDDEDSDGDFFGGQDVTVSVQQHHVPVSAWSGLPVSSSIPSLNATATPFLPKPNKPTPVRSQLRGFASRVLSAFTPRQNTSVGNYSSASSSSSFIPAPAVISSQMGQLQPSTSITVMNRTPLTFAPVPTASTRPATLPINGPAVFGAPSVSYSRQALLGAPPAQPVVRPASSAAGTARTSGAPAPIASTRPAISNQSDLSSCSRLVASGAPPVSSSTRYQNYNQQARDGLLAPPSVPGHGSVATGAPPVHDLTVYNPPQLPPFYGPASGGALGVQSFQNPALFGAPSTSNQHLHPPDTSSNTVCSPDDWIYDVDHHRRSAPAGYRSLVRLPKSELPFFDGDPMKWPMFIQTFGAQVDRVCSDDSERLPLLASCLSESIKLQLGHLLNHPSFYRQCLIELHRRYGNPRVVSAACSRALLSLTAFQDNDFNAMRDFSASLRSAVATLRMGGFGAELQSNATLATVIGKLPKNMCSRWAEHSFKIEDHIPDLVDLDDWLDNCVMAEHYVRAGNESYSPAQSSKKKQQQKSGESFKPKSLVSQAKEEPVNDPPSSGSCANCKRPHPTRDCRKFRDMDVAKRAQLVKENNLCFCCLEEGHSAARCPTGKKKKCGVDGCKSSHHKLLHNAPRMYSAKEKEKTVKSSVLSSDESKASVSSVKGTPSTAPPSAPFAGAMASSELKKVVLLPFVPVVISSGGRTFSTVAALDTCSEVTMAHELIKDSLSLTGPAEETTIGSWHANDPSFISTRVGFKVSSVNGEYSFNFNGAYTVQSLNITKRPVDYKKLVKKFPHLAGLPLLTADPSEVMLLIGQDHADALEIFEYRKDPVREHAPRAILTPFGWTVTGNVWPAMCDDRSAPYCHLISKRDAPEDDWVLGRTLEQYMFLDDFGARPHVKPPESADVKRSRMILDETTKYVNEEKRYEAGLLWKYSEPSLPFNQPGVIIRLNRTMKRMERDKLIAATVHKEMELLISSGFARQHTATELASAPAGRTWFLPWHPVEHPHKPGKWRIVFDAAAVFGGISLNSQLLKGEVILVNLIGILLRFRQHRVALSADVRKMFYQVLLKKEDSFVYLFMYKPEGSTDPPYVYQMARHIFGSICSPAICASVLRRAAIDADPDDTSIAVHQVDYHFYVDNWLSSFESNEEAIKSAAALTRALKKGGFELAEWGSSSPAVFRALPGQPVTSLNMDLDHLPTERTLGLSLDFNADAFLLKASSEVDCQTHREILRSTASNFDPLGFLAPVLLHSKLILRKASKFVWDQQLDSSIVEEWKEWATSLKAVNDLRIPRCFYPGKYEAVDLLMFSDASEVAYGCNGYFRFELADGSAKMAFVMAKTKLAPLKYLSMPRLELCGCLLSTRLAVHILKETQFNIRDVVLFTDSTTCLRWFNSRDCKFTIYVGNRVGEVVENFDASHWRYVPTDLNPADDLSRGIAAAELTLDHRYLSGPSFALDKPESWPTLPDLKLPSDAPQDPEIRALKWVGALHVEPDNGFDKLLTSILPFSRVKRTVAFMLRWINGFKARKKKKVSFVDDSPSVDPAASAFRPSVKFRNRKLAARKDPVPELSPEEIESATVWLIMRAQREVYAKEVRALLSNRPLDPSSPIASVNPYLDRVGLLRVGGRIELAPVASSTRNPIILPPKAEVTRRIINYVHIQAGHSSPWRTVPEIQRQYWISAPRRVIKCVVDRCPLCRRYAAKNVTPLMAALPAVRLQPFQPAFSCTGVDYFGPIEVTIFRRKVKRWGCLFTCMTTRAVHLEMAYGFDTDSFLFVLDNFKAARGSPHTICSDNGTNFKAAERELAEALDRLDQTKIYSHLSLKGIEWRFNPPAAPHFGGSWERLVQSAKRALAHVLHQQHFTDQSLSSALKQVEHLLNSRPLTFVCVDPKEPEPLTPFHLLLGRANPNIPPDKFTDDDLSHRRRWRVTQAIADQFWRRWMAEYLPNLNERRKWITPERNLKEGDIVLIIEEKTPRGQWPLGRVMSVNKDRHGVVRSACSLSR